LAGSFGSNQSVSSAKQLRILKRNSIFLYKKAVHILSLVDSVKNIFIKTMLLTDKALYDFIYSLCWVSTLDFKEGLSTLDTYTPDRCPSVSPSPSPASFTHGPKLSTQLRSRLYMLFNIEEVIMYNTNRSLEFFDTVFPLVASHLVGIAVSSSNKNMVVKVCKYTI
jgi:hypothetical protein